MDLRQGKSAVFPDEGAYSARMQLISDTCQHNSQKKLLSFLPSSDNTRHYGFFLIFSIFNFSSFGRNFSFIGHYFSVSMKPPWFIFFVTLPLDAVRKSYFPGDMQLGACANDSK